jgi:hypothetical protein
MEKTAQKPVKLSLKILETHLSLVESKLFIPLIPSLNRQNLAFKTHEIIGHIIYYFRNAAVKIEYIPATLIYVPVL